MTIERIGDLEVRQDLPYQQRQWVVQRVGWVGFLLIGLAGVLGLFGDGPYSHAVERSDDGTVEVQFDRIDRHRSPSSFEIAVSGDLAEGNEVQFWVDRGFAEGLQITNVYPEPKDVLLGAERLIYVIDVEENPAQVRVSFNFEHDRIGRAIGRAGVVGGASVTFRQFIFP